ncbi:XRE family transcriptional regulator [Paraflavitalea sp. CAU 1676]|uniref:helix-turn-helix domain-containing protein n=1 Tax=Paraflavitalea sp. CAU 1676 TaxID=3032598 RepID=UPI0023DA78E5|nr:XRE family transcriptional regulator [Paraflavitalea sp. CAU 1676]MDF2192151.1 XRE family transcriptional regulator [Paraflavitalea sp. CAU 1676]
MQEDMLLQISNKIKVIRKQKNITVQELASKADVSKGLISQIENNRAVPSLPVLMSIVQALNLDLNEFFKDITPKKKTPPKVILKSPKDYQTFEKEYAKGFLYHRVFTRTIHSVPVDFVLLEMKKGARRNKLIQSESVEYNYMVKGKVEYHVDGKSYIFSEGESIFLDSRMPHKLANIGDGDALMLVVYFFITDAHK